MIRRIFSDLKSFKTLTFSEGLNILLADKTQTATDRQSRNGAGKTSFIELIHFLFGATANKNSIFLHPALIESTFLIDVDLKTDAFVIARSGEKPNRIEIRSGDPSSWPIKPGLERESGTLSLTNKNWCLDLGNLLFDLPIDLDTYSPTFRSLFSYFVRREGVGGFFEHKRQNEKQQPWDQQVNLSYLLDLDWSVPQRFEEIRQEGQALKQLKKISGTESFSYLVGRAAPLRTKVAVVEAKTEKLRSQLADFQVVPEYADLEREASRITVAISELNDANTSDRELLLNLQNSLDKEKEPGIANIEQLYREAGFILPQQVTKRFEEVETFHHKIIENRRSHLADEIQATQSRVKNRDNEKSRLDKRRSQIMNILSSGGALQHYTALQEELARMEADAEKLRQQLETAEKIESTKAKLDIDRAQLYKRLQDDHHEQSQKIKEAILKFEGLSTALYEDAGNLTIQTTEKGPDFDIQIDGMRSRGINKMQIFCFDMMIMEMCAKRGIGPGFLIHDSHLFDGVDERQIAKALQLAASRSTEYGFQYILTMNSDDLPRDGFENNFNVEDYIMNTRLTDARETGGLFGLRFN